MVAPEPGCKLQFRARRGSAACSGASSWRKMVRSSTVLSTTFDHRAASKQKLPPPPRPPPPPSPPPPSLPLPSPAAASSIASPAASLRGTPSSGKERRLRAAEGRVRSEMLATLPMRAPPTAEQLKCSRAGVALKRLSGHARLLVAEVAGALLAAWRDAVSAEARGAERSAAAVSAATPTAAECAPVKLAQCARVVEIAARRAAKRSSSLSLIDPSELKNLRGESNKRQTRTTCGRRARSALYINEWPMPALSDFYGARTYWNSRVCSSSLIERSRRWLTASL